MTSLGRNAPCPCGSGKKYKQCCLKTQQDKRALRSARQDALSRALAWLEKRYPRELDRALEEDFFAGRDRGELRKKLAGLPPRLSELVEANAREWLLSEAVLRVDGRDVAAAELTLAPRGADLPPEGRRWVEAVRGAPLGLYETETVKPEEGLSLRDLLRPEAPSFWVPDRVASGSMREGEVLGARLAQLDGEWRFTGALYPFPRVAVPELLKELREDTPDPGDPNALRRRLWRTIVAQWLRFISESPILEEEAPELVRGKSEEARAEIRGRILRDSLRGFYENWADEPLPALGERSPREAVATAEGLEAVLALLETYERDEAVMAERQGREPLDFGFLRASLGLGPKA